MNEEALFNLALDKPPQERSAFLDDACAGDVELRRRVESLLNAHDNPGSFLRDPALASAGAKPAEATQALDAAAARPTDGPETQADAQRPGDEDLAFLAPSTRADSLGRLDHYHVLEIVGKGGFGTVLKAFDEKLHRVVAIKTLSMELSASGTARQRFIREARSAAAVTHEHVVTIHSVVEEHRPPYLVMQMIDGVTLQEKLDKTGTLSLREILRIGMQTADGLAAAHKQGLVHRDIKPANILLENGIERVKITDFGLARAVDDASVTQSGTVAGTPMYMSPEQAEGLPIDHRSDLFSLGTVLYVMGTGRPPFRATGTMAVLKRVIDDTPRPIRESNPEVPDWLCDIISKLHAKKPEERFQTAREVAELLGQNLAEVQAGRAIEWRAGSVSDRSSPSARRGSPDPADSWDRRSPEAAAAGDLQSGVSAGSGDPRRALGGVAGKRSWLAWIGAIILFSIGGQCVLAGMVLMNAPEGVLTEGRFAAPFFTVGGLALIAWGAFILMPGGVLRRRTGFAAGALMVGAFIAPIIYNRVVPLPPPMGRLEVTTQAVDVKIEVIHDEAPSTTHVLPPQAFAGVLFDKRVPVGSWKVIAYRGDKVHYQVELSVSANETRRVLIPEKDGSDAHVSEHSWVPLFNGKDLTGWRSLQPFFEVKNGILEGNGLLIHEDTFENFHLRVEAKFQKHVSGMCVCFRSQPGVNLLQSGYDAAIESEHGGKWSAVLYGHPRDQRIQSNETAVRPDEWFVMDVIAQGEAITVKINGVVTADVINRAHARGHIALGRPANHVEFKSVQIKQLPSGPIAEPGWVQLFNGKEAHGLILGAWQIDKKNGLLLGNGQGQTYVFTERDDYADFHLKAELGCNVNTDSAIFFRCGKELHGDFPAGYQVYTGTRGGTSTRTPSS
ncbi:MAG: DUF1080 domain-containing protein [Planctomycetes bacterium]|nr:DUF1080 domain-containing protein [Planctomycetota bacterium]